MDLTTGPKLASIIVYAASIEHFLERAIWVFNDIDPKGVQPETDCKPISQLIEMLEQCASHETDASVQKLLKTWCCAARSGCSIRNTIAHGVSLRIAGTLVLSLNPQWLRENRNRQFSDLWCEPHTLDLIRESFASLLRIIAAIAGKELPLIEIASPTVLKAVNDARSILVEFSDQYYNPSFEKY